MNAANEPPPLNEVPGANRDHTKHYFGNLRWAPASAKDIIDVLDAPGRRDTFHLHIAAEQNAHLVNVWNFRGSQSGHAVIAITNVTPRRLTPLRYPLLQLDSGETAYLFVGLGRGHGRLAPAYRGLWFYKVADDGSAPSVAQANYLTYCRIPNPPTVSDVHEDPDPVCAGPHAQVAPRHRVAGPHGHEQRIHDTGLWVSCVGGCCYASKINPLQ